MTDERQDDLSREERADPGNRTLVLNYMVRSDRTTMWELPTGIMELHGYPGVAMLVRTFPWVISRSDLDVVYLAAKIILQPIARHTMTDTID